MNPRGARRAMEQKLYYLPGYYDIAFSYDVSGEISFFNHCFEAHADLAVRRVLEPACGSGRMMIPLAQRGYHVVGYDISAEMVAYTREKIEQAGLSHCAEVMLGDMRTWKFKETFDAALNLLNTIGYLITDADILQHFRAMAYSLRPGGIYLVELACAPGQLRPGETVADSWTAERDGAKIHAAWFTERYDQEHKLKYNVCKMHVEDGLTGKEIIFIEPHMLRLWYAEDFRRLSAAGGFTLQAIYTQTFEPLPLDTPITGDLGNLYYVLKRE